MDFIPSILAGVAALACLIPMLFAKPPRSSPLKNSMKVNAALSYDLYCWRTVFYLPSQGYVKNMSATAESTAKQVKIEWEKEKDKLAQLWPLIPKENRKYFTETLVTELKRNMESYFDKDEFGACIVLELQLEQLVDAKDFSSCDIHELVKNEFTSCRKLEVLGLEEVDVDPTLEVTERNKEKMQQREMELLHRTSQCFTALRLLALSLFCRQILRRYSSIVGKRMWIVLGRDYTRVVDTLKVSLGSGVVAVALLYAAQQSGLWDMFFPQSPAGGTSG